jgi:alkanesulfonate monooxygenase SsuD/methylene tetrahydromethanopterin reductase-like flavin-dependent oxidoreductase (luciferase family)
MRIWIGAVRPRMLAMIGRSAGGWVSPLNLYVTPEQVPESQKIIDAAAAQAGRSESEIRRLYNVVGSDRLESRRAGSERPGVDVGRYAWVVGD